MNFNHSRGLGTGVWPLLLIVLSDLDTRFGLNMPKDFWLYIVILAAYFFGGVQPSQSIVNTETQK